MTSRPEPRLVRLARVPILARAGALCTLAPGGEGRALEGETADLARAVLGELHTPRTRAQLRAFVADVSGQEVHEGGIVDQLLEALAKMGVVAELEIPPTAPEVAVRPIGPRPRVVLGLTGAVHSLLAPTMVQALQARGMDVRVAVSKSALRLVRAAGLEALTHHEVATSMWSRRPEEPVPHLELARWADLVVVCPASATTLARVARGDFSDLVAAVALSTRAPVILAPSMNESMWDAPSVRRNLAQLEDDGFWIASPSDGIEVADAPDRRAVHRGAAPRADVLADLAAMVVARARAASPDPAALPPDAAAWEALWVDPRGRAWDEGALGDAAQGELLAAVGAAGKTLEVGVGSGLLAAVLARAGHRVVATDVSRTALAVARAAAAGVDVTLLVDDVCDSALEGPFDAIVDRACLHALPLHRHPRHAATMARLLRPGGVLVLVVDAIDAPAERATHRLDAEAIGALLGTHFELREERATTLPHRGGTSPARLFALVRRAVDA